MKAVILAGGSGTRISEETSTKPKPMIEIGGRPILWHIMKMYSLHGINDFIICCGYKGYVIKEYFSNYFLHTSDVTFNLKSNDMKVHQNTSEPWNVTLVNTGEYSMTGGRLLKVANYLEEDDNFCMTYGDGVSDINISKVINFHQKHGKLATVTAVFPTGRFGALDLEDDTVSKFREKPLGDGSMINGGFFVLSPKVLKYIDDDFTVWEQKPLQNLAADKQLKAYKHEGFWHPMDTLRDKKYLDDLWEKNEAPWMRW